MEKKKNAKVETVPEIVLVIGASGSGKGFCFGRVMEGLFGAFHYETGAFCRANYQDMAASGAMAPDKAILEDIRRKYLHHVATHSQKRFMVDSPRNEVQAKQLIDMFLEIDPDSFISAVEVRATPKRCRQNMTHRRRNQKRKDDEDGATVTRRLNTYFGIPGGKKGVRDIVRPYLKKRLGPGRCHVLDGMQSLGRMRAYSKRTLAYRVFPSAKAT